MFVCNFHLNFALSLNHNNILPEVVHSQSPTIVSGVPLKTAPTPTTAAATVVSALVDAPPEEVTSAVGVRLQLDQAALAERVQTVEHARLLAQPPADPADVLARQKVRRELVVHRADGLEETNFIVFFCLVL